MRDDLDDLDDAALEASAEGAHIPPPDLPDDGPTLTEFLRDRIGDEDPETLRELAAPYTDHPDYRDEWRPS